MRFRQALARCLAHVPHGRAATCGEIAIALGDPWAARAVAAFALANPSLPSIHCIVHADGLPLSKAAGSKLRRDGVRMRSGRVVPQQLATSIPRIGFLDRLREEQRRFAARVSEEDDFETARIIGGADVAYGPDHACSAAVRWDAETHETIEQADARLRVDFPYITGYLAYREFPAIRAVLSRLEEPPDVLLVDGHGRLHPARFGLACRVGVQLNLPTIGVAKRPLEGIRRTATPSSDRLVRLELDGDICGFAWTPPKAARPIYISVGHRVSLLSALRIVQASTIDRIPEPLHLADLLARKRRQRKMGKGCGV